MAFQAKLAGQLALQRGKINHTTTIKRGHQPNGAPAKPTITVEKENPLHTLIFHQTTPKGKLQMNQTTELITKIREKDAKKFGITIRIERSESLEWVILSDASGKEMAIHWDKTGFRLNAVEGYTQTGFISSLETPPNVARCRKIIRTYFTHGYERIFTDMLEARCRETKFGKSLSMEEFKRSILKMTRNSRRRKSKPKHLEIPPSLVATVQEKGGRSFARPPRTRKPAR